MENYADVISAIEKSDITAVKSKLSTIENINYIDESGYSFIAYAVHNNNLEIVELLLKANCDINIKDKENGKTCLHYCAKNGNLNIAKYLLKFGAIVTIQDIYENEPLFDVVFKSTLKTTKNIEEILEMIILFLDNGASKNHKNYAGISPLDIAKRSGIKSVIDVLENN